MSAQYEIIRDVGQTLVEILKKDLEKHGMKRVTVVSDTPTDDLLKKGGPTLCIYLYAIEADPRPISREKEVVQVEDDEGQVFKVYKDPPSPLQLRLVLVAATGETASDQLLLGLGMKILLEHYWIDEEQFEGESLGPEGKIHVGLDQDFGFDRQLSLWRILGTQYRISVGYIVYVKLESERTSGGARIIEAPPQRGYKRRG